MGELGELRSRVDDAVERLATANDARRRQSRGLMTLLTDLETKYEARNEELKHCQQRIEALTRENADLSSLVDQLVRIVDSTVATEDDDALFRASAMAEDLIADWQGANDDSLDDLPVVAADDDAADAVAEAEVEATETTSETDYQVDVEITEQPEPDAAARAFAALDPGMRFEDVGDEELANERLDGDPQALAALLETPLAPDVDDAVAAEMDQPFEPEIDGPEDLAAIMEAAELDIQEIDMSDIEPTGLDEADELDPIREMMAADLDIPEIAIDDDEPISRVDADDDTESSIRAMMARLEEAAARAKAQADEAPEAESEQAPAVAAGGAS